ncbi:MAG: orotidine-5'-phosphate decarboxylase [Candidatus Micrarchaeota archaeon]
MNKMNNDLIQHAKEKGTILCFGIDPVLEKIESDKNSVREKIEDYYFKITDALIKEKEIVAIKPNYAYFAQYGFEGLYALKSIIERYKGNVEIILDAKRADIGKTSMAYAREAFDFYGVDALTISPYMGEDSVKPFLREGKLIYMLCRTSNKGAKNFQELEFACNGKKLYEFVAEKAVEWKTGLVVGATSDCIFKVIQITRSEVPFLIPGIGAQGGDLKLVMEAIKNNPCIHRINASSSIAFAYEKHKLTPVESALAETNMLNKEIKYCFPE